ncbi:MAG: TIM barrel protein [Thermoguttaceae bacterium]|nr:TIM barrel protein [Thermoguttaceae bacterium]
MSEHKNNYPKLHNAAWPGVVGKGEGGEPPIDLDTMLDLTAAAEVDGVKFDGFDLFLYLPHIDIDSTVESDDAIKQLADKAQARNLQIGTVVAPIWQGTGGGAAMGDETERARFLAQVRKGCYVAQRLGELGIRPHGNVRIDSAGGVEPWLADPEANQKRIADCFRQACDIADDHGQTLAAEGEICWGGMHSWKRMLELLEMVDRPGTLGFQADMAHTLLYLMGYNAPEDAILADDFDWSDQAAFDAAYKQLTDALRPWTNDLHIAQNDGSVHGSGSHDKTGRHCLANDPNGKLDITRHAGFWLREGGEMTKKIRHLCWDGCMFSNATMMEPQTWNEILAAMIAVRDAHGWQE